MAFTPTEERISRILSIVLHPVIVPTLILVYILFSPGMISAVVPEKYRWLLTALIGILTIAIPLIIIFGLRWMNVIGGDHIPAKTSRNYTYIIILICLFFSWRMLNQMGFNNSISVSMLGCIVALFLVSAINLGWNISAYGAGWGCFSGAVAALLSLGITSGIGVFLVTILLFGIAGTSAIMQKRNTPSQVYAGFVLGFVVMFVVMVLF